MHYASFLITKLSFLGCHLQYVAQTNSVSRISAEITPLSQPPDPLSRYKSPHHLSAAEPEIPSSVSFHPFTQLFNYKHA